jgi:hypothetical protein
LGIGTGGLGDWIFGVKEGTTGLEKEGGIVDGTFVSAS